MSAAILLAAGITSFAGVQPQLAAGGGAVYVTFAAATRSALPDPLTPARPSRRRSPSGRGQARPRPPSRPARRRHPGRRDCRGDCPGQGRRRRRRRRLYRSVDRGRTWSPSIVINDVPGAAREGLHALAANDAGLVVVAWLDLRDKGTRVYAATSRDHGVTGHRTRSSTRRRRDRFESAAIRRWRSTTPTASRCCSATTSTAAATCTWSGRATARRSGRR